jgi:hypothetical protein
MITRMLRVMQRRGEPAELFDEYRIGLGRRGQAFPPLAVETE